MFKSSSVVEQLADHITDHINHGHWTNVLPGRNRLAKELKVNTSTLERALKLLEKKGVLEARGAGRRRRITNQRAAMAKQLAVMIVLYDRDDEVSHHILTLQHQLHEAGHRVIFAPKTLMDLKHDPKRVGAMVERHKVNACIVLAGSKPVLEYMDSQLPTFALFGAMANLDIAGTGPNKIPAMRDAIQRLHDHNLKRIVMVSREEQLRGNLRPLEAAYLEALENIGITPSSYNLPLWENSPKGFAQCLESLFHVTPPDAIFVDEITLFHILQNYLVHQRGIQHRKVMRICMEYHPVFEWYQPKVPHVAWDTHKIVRRIIEWINNVAKDKVDKRKVRFDAKFVECGAFDQLVK